MGTLNIYTQPYDKYDQSDLHWTRTGNAGPIWRLGRVTIPSTSYNFQVRWISYLID